MRQVFHLFRTNSKIVLIFLTKDEMCFTCFLQNATSFSTFLTICEKCFTFSFDKVRKVFDFFCQDVKTIRYFSFVCNFSIVFFLSYVWKNYSSFLKYVPVRSTKLSSNCSNCFSRITLILSSILIIKMKLKKLINYE